MLAMMTTQPLGDEHVQRLVEQRFRRVPEEVLHGLVGEANSVAIVDHDQCIGREAQQVLGDFVEFVHGQGAARRRQVVALGGSLCECFKYALDIGFAETGPQGGFEGIVLALLD